MAPPQLSPRQIMNRIYKDICGFEIPKADEKAIKQSKGSPTYGEINHQALVKLLDYLKLTSDDVLYDLGSGVGKVVLQTALLTPVKKAVGVELSTNRHQDAELALANARSFAKDIDQRCLFTNADLMSVDLTAATVVYTCSTAFSAGFMNQVTKRLGEFSHNFRLISLQDLPNERHFILIDKLRLDMSWIRNTPVYIYRRS